MNKVLTVDPGHVTGFSIWEDGDLAYAGQEDLEEFVAAVGWHFGVWPESAPSHPQVEANLKEHIAGVGCLIIEDWALYPWKLQKMAWDKCHTARGIGALQYICHAADVPYVLQPAKIKESAVAGGAEEQFLRPLHENRHANDAIMHGVYYYLTEGNG